MRISPTFRRTANVRVGSQGDETRDSQFLPLWDRKADVAFTKLLCTAAIGSIVRFLIGKRTLGMVPVNDHFWPK